ncbi:hypothetical protein FSB64_22290 [Paraburkholderia sp. JPY454]|uniref:Uncharacterized protein n=2 Tax=Paraburkholderia youngii TaxID=2782701 RepID=A0ABX2NQ11_9BURK|nr:hypothetical protein [Paraburkholderia youngii]
MNDTMLTFQPYLQCAWQLQNGSTITPGLKVLPSLILHQQITPQWSAYAQYAQGRFAPITA